MLKSVSGLVSYWRARGSSQNSRATPFSGRRAERMLIGPWSAASPDYIGVCPGFSNGRVPSMISSVVLFLATLAGCTGVVADPLVANSAAPQTPAGLSSPATPTRTLQLGTNLDANSYYDSGGRWVNASHQFSGFFGCKDYTDQGYPLEDADAICEMKGYPAGTYHLSYQGTATIVIPGATVQNVQGPTAAAGADGVTTAEVVVAQADNFLRIHVSKLDPQHPLRNLKLICPGYPVDTTQVFRPEYAKWLAPFTTVRFMDWEMMNSNAQQHWNQHIKPDQWDQTSFGVAYEYMVSLANDAHKDAWVCVPLQADDDYVRHLAQLCTQFKQKVHVELSNELWNDGMRVNFMANWTPANDPVVGLAWDGKFENGKIVPYTDANGHQVPGTDGRCRSARRAAERAAQVGRIFRNVFASRAGQLRIVWAGQAMWDAWARDGLQWIDAKWPGGAAAAFDELAIAPYFVFRQDLPAHATIEQCFQSCRNYIDHDLSPNLDAHAVLATKYHLALITYEGGQHLFPWGEPITGPGNLPTAMQTDPRMGQLYTHLLNVCQQKGFVLFMNFSYISPWSKWGYWGVLQSNLGPATPRYQALADWSAGKTPPADAQP